VMRFKESGAGPPKAAPIISLLTDFGTRDWFVGALRGVLAQTCSSQVLDVTHDVPSGNVPAAAYVLRQSYAYFPPGTVHLAAIDHGIAFTAPFAETRRLGRPDCLYRSFRKRHHEHPGEASEAAGPSEGSARGFSRDCRPGLL